MRLPCCCAALSHCKDLWTGTATSPSTGTAASPLWTCRARLPVSRASLELAYQSSVMLGASGQRPSDWHMDFCPVRRTF